MIYKFRFKCVEGFQLVEASDLEISLRAITLTVKNFSTASFMLLSQEKYFCCTSVFKFKQIRNVLG